MGKPEFKELNPPERTRVYNFQGGSKLVFQDVRRIKVSASNHHYLELGDGTKHIVSPGWLCIDLDVDSWSF